MNTRKIYTQILLPLACVVLLCRVVSSQAPFARTGQIFLVLQNTNELVEFMVNSSLQINTLGPPPAGGIDAVGFRKTDNLLYGINPANNHLYKIGKNAVAQDLGAAGLDNTLFYTAGDVSPDGKYLVSVGSNSLGADVHLAKTDLVSVGFNTTFVPLSGGNGSLADIAFDPYTGEVFGYDVVNKKIVTININTGAMAGFPPISNENRIYGLYFDAFGDLYAHGSAVYSIVDALFLIDKTNGKETLLATGPVSPSVDVASCPFSVEIKNAVAPLAVLPCSDLKYSYTIANGSGTTLTGVDFEHPLPPGFHFASFLQNPFGIPVDTLSLPGAMRLNNLTLVPGVTNLSIKMTVGDIAKGPYNSQATLEDLPVLYGEKSLSDNPETAGFEDPTAVSVNRFDEDTLFFRWFICHGETLTLDATAYGGNVHWNTGATSAELEVSKGAVYTLEAGNTCEEIFVSHDVTSASCPFTIEVEHVFVPDTLFACSELIFRFLLDNDSGEPRKNVSFADTLPPGFALIKVLKNPFGGSLKPNLPSNLVCLEGMNLKPGKDTLDILVEAGDVAPGDYKNRAIIFNLPQIMGPSRWSDNPATLPADSTSLHILGAHSDTLFFEEIICPDAEITLDASDLGKSFLWDDGSTGPKFPVKQPGDYHLTLLDGCKPAQAFWNVAQGDPIEVASMPPFFIHQGEQVVLEPLISNQGDTLAIQWTDPLGNSLSCLDCPNPVAMPLQSTVYGIRVFNGICFDSAGVAFEVDKTRRIFAPNIFSPNDDGINDFFFLQSPDYGIIKSFSVFDRWSNRVFFSDGTVFNDISNGWDGRSKCKPVPAGVYLWRAEVEFIDGTKNVYTGDVTVLR